MPKDLQQATLLAPEHVEVARVRVAPQRLLNLECEPFKPRRISVWQLAS